MRRQNAKSVKKKHNHLDCRCQIICCAICWWLNHQEEERIECHSPSGNSHFLTTDLELPSLSRHSVGCGGPGKQNCNEIFKKSATLVWKMWMPGGVWRSLQTEGGIQAMERRRLGSNLSSATYKLWDCGQVTSPLWSSAPHHGKVDDET